MTDDPCNPRAVRDSTVLVPAVVPPRFPGALAAVEALDREVEREQEEDREHRAKTRTFSPSMQRLKAKG